MGYCIQWMCVWLARCSVCVKTAVLGLGYRVLVGQWRIRGEREEGRDYASASVASAVPALSPFSSSFACLACLSRNSSPSWRTRRNG